jgi:hypothetical protein
MVLQIPIIGFFAIRWLPRAPVAAIQVLGIHAGAWLAAVGLVVFLDM